jgi:N,N'-diacetylbacillosaminyl-diphospho-undecaprenol alpha-1,3-N-acetylgalactosaminyltransferase
LGEGARPHAVTASERNGPIALVCPDGLSVLLFCKGIVRSLQAVEGSRVVVITDAGAYSARIQSLGVEVIDVPYPRWSDPFGDVKYCLRLFQALRRTPCAGLLNFSTKSNIYGAIAGRFARTPLIVSHVVGLGKAFQGTGTGARFLRTVFLGLYRISCRWSHSVWFTNRNDLRLFSDLRLVDSSKCVLSANYLDTNEYRPDSVLPAAIERTRAAWDFADNERVVVMVARMIWAKGIREFAEAAEILRESHPWLRFVLVAPLETGSSDAVPESYIRQKEQTSRLRWVGFQEDVRPFYALADLAVLPTFYKEGGYPRALLEPMSMGKPVITTTSEDCRGVVEEGQNGLLVPIRDSSALARAIARVMDDNGLRVAMGQYSRTKAVRDFDERTIVPQALRQLGFAVGTG